MQTPVLNCKGVMAVAVHYVADIDATLQAWGFACHSAFILISPGGWIYVIHSIVPSFLWSYSCGSLTLWGWQITSCIVFISLVPCLIDAPDDASTSSSSALAAG